MTYTMKTIGKASFKSIDLSCPNCGYEEERSIDLRDLDEDGIQQAMLVKCPNCDHEHMEQVWRRAPAAKFGNDQTPENIARMKRSFDERFVKKDMDNVRHKFGRLFDESLVSKAVDKAKKK